MLKKILKEIRNLARGYNWTSWIQAVSSALLIPITLYVACTANSILQFTSEKSNEIQLEHRRAQIKPDLRFTAKQVHEGKGGTVITMTNIGTGAAKDIAIFFEQNNNLDRLPFRVFYPKGTFPTSYDKRSFLGNLELVQSIDLIFMHPFPDSIFGQSFIHPNSELEFQYGDFGEREANDSVPIAIYALYFDIDDNEYTTVTKLIPGFANANEAFQEGHPLLDTLQKLSKTVGLYEYRTLLKLGLRDSAGLFYYIPPHEKPTRIEK